MKAIKHLAFVINGSKSGSGELVANLEKIANRAGIDCRSITSFPVPEGSMEGADACCVIGGDGAFTMPVRSGKSIIDGIKRKLVLEIAGAEPRPRIIRAGYMPAVGNYGSDCQVGERLLRQWWDSTEDE